MTKRDFEVVVVGLGGIGGGAAYWLSRRAGADVLGLERFEFGHARGASHDHSRIIRLSYHTPEYVRFAKAAYEAWAALEEDAGETLIVRTGGLDLYPEGGAISMDDYTKSLEACGVPYEVLDAGETMKRWPQFRLSDDVVTMYQAESGIAPAARCNAAHLRMARERGATLFERSPATSIREVGGEYEVRAGGRTYRCAKVVVTADAWTNEVLAQFGTRIPLTITQEQVAYFATPDLDAFSPERFPIWIWMDDPSFYGVPAFGEAGTKIGQDVGGREVTAETRSFDIDPDYLLRLERFMEAHIPTALGPLIAAKTCLYAMTPDRDFVIDALPGHPRAFVAQGAAHAFKFASVIGRTLAELAMDGRTDQDISAFRIDRPILAMEDPPKRFMV